MDLEQGVLLECKRSEDLYLINHISILKTSRETKRQTEETMEDSIKEWIGLKCFILLQKGVEEAGCKINSGAPTVSQTMG